MKKSQLGQLILFFSLFSDVFAFQGLQREKRRVWEQSWKYPWVGMVIGEASAMGMLISPTSVLTSIWMGSYFRAKSVIFDFTDPLDESTASINRTIDACVEDPKWSFETGQYSFAICKFSPPITEIPPIPLDITGKYTTVGTKLLFISGGGSSQNDSLILKEEELVIREQSECEKAWGEKYGEYEALLQFCASDTGNNVHAFDGQHVFDFGAPLLYDTGNGYLAVGMVVSYDSSPSSLPIQALKVSALSHEGFFPQCQGSPCLNGGTCKQDDDDGETAHCLCLPTFSGPNCEISKCSPNPCQNGGTCHLEDDNNFSCSCSNEFRGFLCQYLSSTIAHYSFSSSHKLFDGTGNEHNLSPFKTQSMSYPLSLNNDALIFFGQDIIHTSSPTITLGNSFAVSFVFSISKFYFTSNMIFFTPDDHSSIRPLSLMITSSGSIRVSSNGFIIMKTENQIISLNTPYLVTFTKNGNNLRLYLNGILIQTSTILTPINIENNNIYLGYNFIGILDEVSIHSSAITPTQVSHQNSLLSLPMMPCDECSNKGICGKLNVGQVCFCPQCYSGATCETQLSGCLNPCLNGGIKINGICECAAGYFGPTCSLVRTCGEIINLNRNLPKSIAYQGVIGVCSSEKITRQCLHDGTWQDIFSCI